MRNALPPSPLFSRPSRPSRLPEPSTALLASRALRAVFSCTNSILSMCWSLCRISSRKRVAACRPKLTKAIFLKLDFRFDTALALLFRTANVRIFGWKYPIFQQQKCVPHARPPSGFSPCAQLVRCSLGTGVFPKPLKYNRHVSTYITAFDLT